MVDSFDTPTLREATLRYLNLRRELGEREVVLPPHTIKALREIRRRIVRPDEKQNRQQPASARQAVLESEPPSPVRQSNPPVPTRPAAVTASISSVSSIPRFTFGPLVPASERQSALETIRQAAAGDPALRAACPADTPLIFGEGDPNASLLFIGEAPTREDSEQGRPFCGATGELLEKMIAAMGLSRSTVYLTHVLKFYPSGARPSAPDRKPRSDEIAACRPFLMRELDVIHPKVIVTLGATALGALLGLEKVAITRLRGTWHELDGVPVMPTFHPLYLLNHPHNIEKRRSWEDLLAVMERLGLPISDKQRRYFLKAIRE